MLDKDKNCMYNYVNLSFCRYGFEKSFRAEKKGAIVLMPLISDNYADLSGQVLKLSRRIHSGKENFWNSIRQNCGKNAKTPVVMLAPVGTAGTNILNRDPMERLAWLESIVRNDSMNFWISQAVENHHLDKSGHPALNYDTSFLLRDLISNRSSREEYAFSARSEIREEAFTSAIIANIVNNRRSANDRINTLHHLMYSDRNYAIRSGDGKFNKNAVSLMLYQHLFQPHLVSLVKKMLVREFGQEITPLFKEPELVRGCLLELSACLVRTGKIDGKKAMSVGQ
jgi:hypothetical protein